MYVIVTHGLGMSKEFIAYILCPSSYKEKGARSLVARCPMISTHNRDL